MGCPAFAGPGEGFDGAMMTGIYCKGGRPKSLNRDKRRLAVALYREKQLPVKKICEMMNISKPT